MSVPFDKLKETFEVFDTEYQSWVASAKFPPDKIGNGAFTMQEASDLLLEFCETIKVVLENKEQCIKHVSSGELNAICKCLSSMMDVAKKGDSSVDYTDFANKIDELIPYIRSVKFSLNINEAEGVIQRSHLSMVKQIIRDFQAEQAKYKQAKESCIRMGTGYCFLGALSAFGLVSALGLVSDVPAFFVNVILAIVLAIATVLFLWAIIVQFMKYKSNKSHEEKYADMAERTESYIATKFKDMETYAEYKKRLLNELFPRSVKGKT